MTRAGFPKAAVAGVALALLVVFLPGISHADEGPELGLEVGAAIPIRAGQRVTGGTMHANSTAEYLAVVAETRGRAGSKCTIVAASKPRSGAQRTTRLTTARYSACEEAGTSTLLPNGRGFVVVLRGWQKKADVFIRAPRAMKWRRKSLQMCGRNEGIVDPSEMKIVPVGDRQALLVAACQSGDYFAAHYRARLWSPGKGWSKLKATTLTAHKCTSTDGWGDWGWGVGQMRNGRVALVEHCSGAKKAKVRTSMLSPKSGRWRPGKGLTWRGRGDWYGGATDGRTVAITRGVKRASVIESARLTAAGWRREPARRLPGIVNELVLDAAHRPVVAWHRGRYDDPMVLSQRTASGAWVDASLGAVDDVYGWGAGPGTGGTGRTAFMRSWDGSPSAVPVLHLLRADGTATDFPADGIVAFPALFGQDQLLSVQNAKKPVIVFGNLHR